MKNLLSGQDAIDEMNAMKRMSGITTIFYSWKGVSNFLDKFEKYDSSKITSHQNRISFIVENFNFGEMFDETFQNQLIAEFPTLNLKK